MLKAEKGDVIGTGVETYVQPKGVLLTMGVKTVRVVAFEDNDVAKPRVLFELTYENVVSLIKDLEIAKEVLKGVKNKGGK